MERCPHCIVQCPHHRSSPSTLSTPSTCGMVKTVPNVPGSECGGWVSQASYCTALRGPAGSGAGWMVQCNQSQCWAGGGCWLVSSPHQDQVPGQTVSSRQQRQHTCCTPVASPPVLVREGDLCTCAGSVSLCCDQLRLVVMVVWLPLAGWVGSLVTNVHHQPGSRHPVAAE